MRLLLKQLFPDLPYLPDSLQQKQGNPTQLDRLPQSAKVELEFPVTSGSIVENRKSARRFVITGLVLIFILGLVKNFDHLGWSKYAIGIVSSFGFLWFLRGYFEARPSWKKWIAYLIIFPHAVFLLVILREPYVTLIFVVASLVPMADLFAAHFFHLQTTAPMQRDRALQLRSLWSLRFRFASAARGIELYGLGVWLTIAALFGLVAWTVYYPPQWAIQNLPRLIWILVGLVLAPIVVEQFAAFIYGRPPRWPLVSASRFGAAVAQWLTYNRAAIQTPGTYQTPAGSCLARRRMSIGIALLLASFTIPLFDLRRDGRHYWSLKFAEREARNQQQESLHDPNPDSLLGQRAELAEPPPPSFDNGEPIEPYQQRMLDRMSPEERAAYLKSKTNQPTETNQTGWEPEYFAFRFSNLVEWLGQFYQFLYNVFYPAASSLSAIGLLFALLYSVSSRVLSVFAMSADVDPSELFSSQRWDSLVSRVRASEDKTERDSLLLGVNAEDNSPVLVPRSVFQEHAHLLGDSGSGKTSIGIASILSQLVRFGDCSVIVLDLKGDDVALFEGARREAEAASLRFRWFTNQLQHSTYIFNPLQQRYLDNLSSFQKADMLTAAMGLQYGRDYGRAFYADANARYLHRAFEYRDSIDSFHELGELLEDSQSLGIDRQLQRDASHAKAIVNRLGDINALNLTDLDDIKEDAIEGAIQFDEVFKTPQLVYFHLASTLGATSSAEIARIALYSLLGAASSVHAAERKQTYVFIDEFQRIVSGNLELLLQLARSLNIGIILANQTLNDLDTGGVNLIPPVAANTRYKQVFAASYQREQEDLIKGSGESMVYKRAWHEFFGLGGLAIDGRNLSEEITPRLRANDVLLATDHPLQSIVQVHRGAGFAQYGGLPFVMRSCHHISLEEYQNRKQTGWPEGNAETVIVEASKSKTPLEPSSEESPFLEDRPAPRPMDPQHDPLFQMYQEQQAKLHPENTEEESDE